MPSELLYTSVPRGLLPGRSGYCTVAATAGLSTSVIEQLERLSGYLSLPETESATGQAEAFSHWRMPVHGKTHSVLSRVTSAGMDYTGRLRKEIYHLVLNTGECPAAGPAWLASQPLVMDGLDENGHGEAPTSPHWIRGAKRIPSAACEPKPCVLWEAATGDAGWAGFFAAHVMSSAAKVAYLICPCNVSSLGLFGEAMLLLPRALRWKVSFNTCFSTLPGDLTCSWRCVATEPSSKIGSTFRRAEHFVLDLSDVPRRAPTTPASEAARDGRVISSSSIPASPPPGETTIQRSHG